MRIWPALTLCALVVGFGLGVSIETHREGAKPLTCRPTLPKRAIGDQPAVLFWGNSLAFDHSWRLGTLQTVNCAVQGMTAVEAAPRTVDLPRMTFKTVVLIFGTVELVRDSQDTEAFQRAMATMVGDLKGKYPGAQIIAMGIPTHVEPEVWAYGDDPQLGALNATLEGLGVTFLDSTQALAPLAPERLSYDRIHLTSDSYALLEAAFLDVLN